MSPSVPTQGSSSESGSLPRRDSQTYDFLPNRECFGVFGDRESFIRLRSVDEFDRVVDGPATTVGLREPELTHDATARHLDVYTGSDGICVLWGETYPPEGVDAANPAEWTFERFDAVGTEAFAALNGSYFALVDDGDPVVAVDPMRTRECFYTDAPAVRAFGTHAATVARTIPDPAVDVDGLREFLHLCLTTGETTLLQSLRRVPLDGYLTSDGAGEFRRFVYAPETFDYVDELVDAFRRALSRRADLPGPRGALQSAGYDSRSVLLGPTGVDTSYTVGTGNVQEVRVAGRIARQYGVDHHSLAPGDTYLNTEWDVIRHGEGIKESIHAHHAGLESQLNCRTLFHGLAIDTLVQDYYIPTATVEAFGVRLPRYGLEADPDVPKYAMKKYGYLPESDALTVSGGDSRSNEAFIRDTVDDRLEAFDDRYDTLHNGASLFGIENYLASSMRWHMADHFFESFLAADADIVAWHLRAPPAHRNAKTMLAALRRLDRDALRHRPPDRPHDIPALNQLEKGIRRRVPGLSAFGTPWPDRREVYDRRGLDRVLFPDWPAVHRLPVRLKLRLNDARTWLDRAAGIDLRDHVTVAAP